MKHPKVLIIGQYFNTESGGGITMTNLFKNWDKESIAVAAEDMYNADFLVCKKCYQLGFLETVKRFPFNLNRWGKQVKSGVISEKKVAKPLTFVNTSKKPIAKKIYLGFLHFTGLYHYKRRYKISNEFLSWIKEFSPDIIYSQLSTIEIIRLVNDLNQTLGLPIAIHIMDDWPSIISSKGLFNKYWHKKIDEEFRDLLNKASLLMSISDDMTSEYKKRYGKTFIPFHNPINIGDWLPFSKNDWTVPSSFRILYTGRIGTANTKSIKKIAEAVNYLIDTGLDISLDIYSPNIHSDEAKSLNVLKGVFLKNIVPHSQIPSLLPSYDLLVLPLDFDQNSIRFAKYSIPTKASEFMISGTPILVYAPLQTALARSVVKDQWAYLVTDTAQIEIINAIKKLYSSSSLREKLGQKAKKLAMETENALVIRKEFKDAISSKVFAKFPQCL